MRSVIGELSNSSAKDVTIVDLEASIEHLSRGTMRDVDALLVITEPYYRSLETAGRLIPLARDLGIEPIWVAGNKIRSDRDASAIREYCARKGLDVVSMVPFDDNVIEADLLGRALFDHMPSTPAVLAIEDMARSLLEQVPSGAGGATRSA